MHFVSVIKYNESGTFRRDIDTQAVSGRYLYKNQFNSGGYPMNSLIYNKEKQRYLAQAYEGENIYKGNSFENEVIFIKSVFGGEF